MQSRDGLTPQTLAELIACYCIVLKTQRVDELRLCATVRLFHDRWVAESSKLSAPLVIVAPASSSSSFMAASSPRKDQTLRTLGMLTWMVALLVEHAGLDALRHGQPDNVTLQDSFQAIAPSSPTLFAAVFDRLVAQYHDRAAHGIRLISLQSLGFLFRSHPTLMLDPAATELMDAIFERAHAAPTELRRLLLIFHDVLARQVQKGSEEGTVGAGGGGELDLTELIGNTEGFAESGCARRWRVTELIQRSVSSAIAQRYLPQIKRSALSTDAQMRNAALDVIGFVVKQGLAHPLEVRSLDTEAT